MKKLILHQIKTIAKLYLFWLLLFAFMRLVFSVVYFGKIENNLSEWLCVFWHSLHLDIAMTSIFLLPIFIWLFLRIQGWSWLKYPFWLWSILCIVISVLIHAGELNVYTEWNHKLNGRIYKHLINPDEVFKTAEYSQTILFVFYIVLELFVARFLWKKLLKDKLFKVPSILLNWKQKLSLSLITFVMFSVSAVMCRGGLQQIPINTNASMFSKHYVINDIAVNSTYFFAKSTLLYKRSNIRDIYPKMLTKEVEKRVANLYNYPKTHNNYFLTKEKPNVVLVLMESWTANAIGCLSNTTGATPNFDALANEGYLFDNIYACGGTSEVGNASLFSGYPAIPEVYITQYIEKSRNIPSFNQSLKKVGYNSSYLFSGDLRYGNIEGYLQEHGFDDLKDEGDFPSNFKKGRLNYYDEDLYALFEERIKKSESPFLQCAFTGSTHSPYDQPKRKNQIWEGTEKDFMKSLIYADEELGNFIARCKKEDWYKNTLFIFTADHGHASPKQTNPNNDAYFRIPLLFYGEVLKEDFKGKRNNKLGSQSDIASTLLYQLKQDNSDFKWSKDLMNPASPEFALHTVTLGYGYKSKEGVYCEKLDDKMIFKDSISEEGKRNSIALINALFDDFESR